MAKKKSLERKKKKGLYTQFHHETTRVSSK
jgi:hypothetical protein